MLICQSLLMAVPICSWLFVSTYQVIIINCCYYMLQHNIVSWNCWYKMAMSICCSIAWEPNGPIGYNQRAEEGGWGYQSQWQQKCEESWQFSWGSSAALWACQITLRWQRSGKEELHHCIFSLYYFHTFLYTPSTLNPQPSTLNPKP